ncbi:MAG: RluA family pseudouridine synthase [Micrococcales bacterium]|nr:RluA family pseudouridine synthase [Micrococcales bacterium]NBR60350.1 RluA family pseudouridine synthase [Actinomycetota bacterium]NBT46246.1 RluA family pseudouridine synthase [Actinomycetota bacterium]NBY43519.1 RluA family pseudouridine synthase [Micrococcales bacterium]
MTEQRLIQVTEGVAGLRADAGISKLLGISRAKVAEMIEVGLVSQNNQIIDKAEILVLAAWLEISLPKAKPALALVPELVPDLKVIYQDRDIVVVDKPAGIAAHPSVGWDGPSVGGALLALGISMSTTGVAERQGIVSRLDVGTSGVMVLTKTEVAYSRMKQAFRDRTVDKTYHALVQGHPDPSSGTIDAPINRHPKHEYKFTVSNEGKPSVTHYQTIEAFKAASLLQIELETGRTHQIRVHMSAFKHPLVGDTLYGCDPKLAARLGMERQWLHAVKLGFQHPTSGDYVSFESECPADLTNSLEFLRTEG